MIYKNIWLYLYDVYDVYDLCDEGWSDKIFDFWWRV